MTTEKLKKIDLQTFMKIRKQGSQTTVTVYRYGSINPFYEQKFKEKPIREVLSDVQTNLQIINLNK
jgi:hypothetical protein